MLIIILVYASLISDEVYGPQSLVAHRLTMDSTMKWTQEHYGERNPIYWDPIDGARYYFTSDSFYLAILDNGWERVVWQKCRDEGSRGFYSGGKMMRYGGKDHAPGVLKKPGGIECYQGTFFVADCENDRVEVLGIEMNPDTMKSIGSYNFGFNNPTDLALNYDLVYKYLYVLDSGNDRYVKIYWPFSGNVLYDYDGINDNIPMDEIVDIAIDKIPGTGNPPRYYVYLLSKDKIYILKEKGGEPPLRLINILEFPNSNFTGMDKSSSVILVVDNNRETILGLASDMSRSYFTYKDSSELSNGVFNIAAHGDEVITFAPFLSSTGIDFFTIDLTNIPDDKPYNLSCEGFEDRVELTWSASSDYLFDEFIIERRKKEESVWMPIGSISFSSGENNYADYNVSI